MVPSLEEVIARQFFDTAVVAAHVDPESSERKMPPTGAKWQPHLSTKGWRQDKIIIWFIIPNETAAASLVPSLEEVIARQVFDPAVVAAHVDPESSERKMPPTGAKLQPHSHT